MQEEQASRPLLQSDYLQPEPLVLLVLLPTLGPLCWELWGCWEGARHLGFLLAPSLSKRRKPGLSDVADTDLGSWCPPWEFGPRGLQLPSMDFFLSHLPRKGSNPVWSFPACCLPPPSLLAPRSEFLLLSFSITGG